MINNNQNPRIIKQGVKKWFSDPSVTGEKERAVNFITEVLNSNNDALDLSGLKLNEIPPEIGSLPLKTLHLSQNFITYIPWEIGQLKGLTFLNLYHNKLQSLPTEVGELKALEHLDLYANKLQSLPKEIGQLTCLRYLGLGDNKLSSLPEEIGNLRRLQTLQICSNPISALPETLRQISNLKIDSQGTNIQGVK